MILLMTANIGGVGGGGIVVPIGIGLFKFDAKNAIAISNASICSSSIIRFLINSRLSHPSKNGKGIIVDMNLSVLMLPMIISGVSVGVIFNIMFPNLVLKVIYVLVVAYFSFGVLKKALSLVEVEKKAKEAKDAQITLCGCKTNVPIQQPKAQESELSEFKFDHTSDIANEKKVDGADEEKINKTE